VFEVEKDVKGKGSLERSVKEKAEEVVCGAAKKVRGGTSGCFSKRTGKTIGRPCTVYMQGS
jgi:hypothetical protein